MSRHRMSDTAEYRTWLRIKTACYNKNNNTYRTYGARGIKMPDHWRESFKNFYDDMGEAPEGFTGVDLIDLDADFSKSNCKWVNATSRRSLKDMPNQKKRISIRKYKKPKRIVITVESQYFEFLQRQAIIKSQQAGTPISAPELIKMILLERAPMPIQLDIF